MSRKGKQSIQENGCFQHWVGSSLLLLLLLLPVFKDWRAQEGTVGELISTPHFSVATQTNVVMTDCCLVVEVQRH